MASGRTYVVVQNPQPATTESCTAVLTTPQELQNGTADIWMLSADEGAQIAVAIMAVWAIAWTGRVLVRSLNVFHKENENV